MNNVENAKYSPELFAEEYKNEKDLLDIHAGALTESSLNIWLAGGKGVRSVVALEYAGNSAVMKRKFQWRKLYLKF